MCKFNCPVYNLKKMPEDKKETDIDASEEYLDDGSKNPNYKAPEDTTDKGGEDKGGEDTGTEDTEEKPDFNDEATPEIPLRRSVAQNIIARKNQTIEKLRSKSKDEDGGESNNVAQDEDDGLSADAKQAIDKALDSRIKPLVESLVSKADEDELKELYGSDPEAKKFDKHIKAYMGHESYKGVPAVVIYHHLAFQQAQAIGAKKKQVADLEAKQTQTRGRNITSKGTSGLPSAEDIENMDEAEFEKMQEDVRQGKYLKK